MVHPSHAAAVAIISTATLIALALTVLALRALERTGEGRLKFVAAAFGLFVLKGAIVAYSLATSWIAHEHLELWMTLFDLMILGLLVAPFLRR